MDKEFKLPELPGNDCVDDYHRTAFHESSMLSYGSASVEAYKAHQAQEREVLIGVTMQAIRKTNAPVVELPDGSVVFINQCEQPEDDSELNCPYCNGSGHKDDVVLAGAQSVAVPDGWQLVPDASNMTDDQAEYISLRFGVCGGIAHEAYLQLLAASPQPPEPEQAQTVDEVLLPAVLALDAAIHTVLIAGGDYGDDLSYASLRSVLQNAQHMAYRALISIGIERLPGAVNPLRAFLPKDEIIPVTMPQARAAMAKGRIDWWQGPCR